MTTLAWAWIIGGAVMLGLCVVALLCLLSANDSLCDLDGIERDEDLP